MCLSIHARESDYQLCNALNLHLYSFVCPPPSSGGYYIRISPEPPLSGSIKCRGFSESLLVNRYGTKPAGVERRAFIITQGRHYFRFYRLFCKWEKSFILIESLTHRFSQPTAVRRLRDSLSIVPVLHFFQPAKRLLLEPFFKKNIRSQSNHKNN